MQGYDNQMIAILVLNGVITTGHKARYTSELFHMEGLSFNTGLIYKKMLKCSAELLTKEFPIVYCVRQH